MRRRDVIAGIGSLGVLAGAGVLAARGPSLLDSEGDSNGGGDPIELETIDAPGSEAGTITVPQPGQAMVVDFFATTCSSCASLMPTVAEAQEAAEDVTFLSVTIERDEEPISAWWEEHGGNWAVGMDPGINLYERYDVVATPTTVAIDGTGEAHWRSQGSKTLEEILEGAAAAREATLEE
ncbi:TlpA family protein disulfide reductase [Natronobeatus ordinarius]|uniref:TlpA family protein disulfide reductase n=1 Tax=Natronobeatus ordinarius TaxID=2963433 RepID=UPI0020CD8971|nr:TlpA disulfide reductase family protein [Natronobeatus ordinarius]